MFSASMPLLALISKSAMFNVPETSDQTDVNMQQFYKYDEKIGYLHNIVQNSSNKRTNFSSPQFTDLVVQNLLFDISIN